MALHSWIHKLVNPQRPKSWTKLSLEALEDRLAPANIVVVNNADAGVGSLRQAIIDSAAGGTISFAPNLAGATITLTDASGPLTISKNLTINGPGADQLTVSGGGVTGVFSTSAGHVEIDGLKITGGIGLFGGGIFINTGTVNLKGDDIETNNTSFGGGVGVIDATLNIQNCTIANNSAISGAGLEADNSLVTITNSTIANNHGYSSSSRGSGISTYCDSPVTSFSLSLESCTLSGNQVLIKNFAADIFLYSVGGSTQTATLHNTILNGATNPAGTPNAGTYGHGATITSLGHNISSDASGNLTAAGDLPSTNPFLGTFDYHGGATPTFNLLFNSPAINNADPLGGAPTCDQRGAIRGAFSGFGSMANAGIAPDIGAFEFSSLYVVTSSDSTTTPAAYDSSIVGTLRGGVEWANDNINLLVLNATPNLVLFDTLGTFATPQTITLALGALRLSNTNVPEAIAGPGATGATALTVSGNNAVQVFKNYATSTISGMTITEGYSDFQGGAIYNLGTLEISNAAITNSSAYFGGGLANLYGNLTISYSTISGNRAFGNGAFAGGVQNSYGTAKLTINSSTLSGNSAPVDSAIGQDIGSPTTVITNSTISGNTSNYSGTVGGSTGTITLLNSTLANNLGRGGVNSNGATLVAKDTIIAGNAGGDVTGNLASQGHNLIGNTAGGSGFVASDLLNVNPLLGPLADNGGPTQTMRLGVGSPAIDHGDNSGAPAFDQRGPGFPRIVNGTIDIGAFEYTPPAATTVFSINRTTPAGQFTNASSVTYTVSFATATLGLGASNLSRTGTAGAGTIGTPTTSDGGLHWSVQVTGLGSANGTLILNLVNDTGLDHLVTNTPFAGQAYTLDHVAPTVSIGAPSKSITNTGPVTYTVTYMDANFKSSMLSTTNVHLIATGTAGGTLGFDNSTGATRTVTISSITGNGTLGICIDAGSGCDLAGNLTPAAGPSTTFTVNNMRPIVSMTSAAPNPTRAGPIRVTVTVSAPVADFTASALMVGNGVVSNFMGSGTSYTFTLSPTTLGTPTTVDIADNAFHDVIGNGNVAAAQFSRTFLASIAVHNFTINPFDTTGQRSMVTTLQVSFTTLITFDAGAFTLAGDNSVVLHPTDTTPAGGTKTVVTITFTGPTIIGHSLADGRYSLTVHGGCIHAGADTMATDRVFSFFRLFGDLNGDGKVDATDQAIFFGVLTGNAAYAQYHFACDYNGDGLVNRDDLTQFFLRIGKTLT